MWKNEERDAKCGKLYKILFYEATFVAAKINECEHVEYLCQEWYDRNVFALASVNQFKSYRIIYTNIKYLNDLISYNQKFVPIVRCKSY